MKLRSRTIGISSKEYHKAPIDCLPVDVLLEIFQFVSGNFLALYKSRITICAVSHAWREIAMGFPGLWTAINVDFAFGYPPIPLLKTWLKRSRDASLSIEIAHLFHPMFKVALKEREHWQPELPNLNDSAARRYAKSVLAVLAKDIHRWKTFSFTMILSPAHNNSHGASLLSALLFQDATRLEVVRLSTGVDGLAEQTALQAVMKAVNLRNLDWQIPNDFHVSTKTTSWWQRLEHVSLAGNIQHLTSVISQCTNAKALNVITDTAFPTQWQPRLTYSLHKLKGLSLRCVPDTLLLLPWMECPNLEILHLVLLIQDEDSDPTIEDILTTDYNKPWELLSTFLTDPNCRLKILRIDDGENLIPYQWFQNFLLTPCRLMKELYGVMMTLSYDIGNAYAIMDDVIGEPEFAQTGIPEPLLQVHQTTDIGDEYFHVGWIREEFGPYVQRNMRLIRDSDLEIFVEDFERLLHPERFQLDNMWKSSGTDIFDNEEENDQ